jgi:hypothetical protein
MEYTIRTDMGSKSRIPLEPSDNLYLGNIFNVLKMEKGVDREKGFWAVLNCTDDPVLDHLKTDAEFDVMRLNQWDGEPYPGMSIKIGIEFIDMNVKAGSNVIVCCHTGISRSPGMVVAYLTYRELKKRYEVLPEAPMEFVRDCYEKAKVVVRKARPFIQIHPEIDKSVRQYFRLSPRTFEDLIKSGY